MADKVCTIMPNADTIVILKNRILDFAPWQQPVLNAAVTTEHQSSGLQPPAVASVGLNSIALSVPSYVVIMLRVAHSLSPHFLDTPWIAHPPTHVPQ